MDRLVHGNLGQSFFFQLPATTLIASRMGATLLLLLMATLFTVVVTIPLAILAAVRRDKGSTTWCAACRPSPWACRRSGSASC